MSDDALPTKSLIERLLVRHAQDTGTTTARVRRWVSTMVLIGALDRVRSTDDSHQFVVKGGVAIELKLKLRARTTQDVDLTFHGEPHELETSLQQAFSDPLSGFSFQHSEPVPIGVTGAHRIDVQVRYRSKGWATMRVEIAVTSAPPIDLEFVPAISLADFRITGPEHVATLSIRYQMAQKLHAVSQTFTTGDNARVRDIIDLLLLAELGPDLHRIREACVLVFDERATHAWPPEIITYDSWPATYSRLAGEIEFPIEDMTEAINEVRDLIDRIDAAT